MNLSLAKKTLTRVAFLQLLSTPVMGEYQKANLSEFLKDFYNNPVKVMNQTPYKLKDEGAVTPLTLNPREIENNWFLHDKDQVRGNICFFDEKQGKKVCANDLNGRVAIGWNDSAESLTDLGSKNIRTLKTMDAKNLKSATLSVRPWSDDYWAIKNGVLAYRYADEGRTWGDWKEVTDYVRNRPANILIESGLVDVLSPAEKYDLLVGDKNYSLTKSMLDEGKTYYDRSGEVEDWMGICHGWSPASFMLPRPKAVAKVLAADGETLIPFFPADIKALGSLLWAKQSPGSRFSGGRCNEKEPKTDSVNGRIVDQNCFDTNPGTWHKAIVNQVGVADRSFVMDATFDYEVWNQPVYSYSYSYFNPQTFDRAESYKDAAVKVQDFKKDKFKEYRSSEAKYIVGVEMVVKYIAETRPSHRSYDKEYLDRVVTVSYRYDLELNSRGSIIGGEWYSNKHPDFLWVPNKGARALTSLDRQIDDLIKNQNRTDLSWKFGEAVPVSWRKNLIYNSRQGIPMGLVVEGLIERANSAETSEE